MSSALFYSLTPWVLPCPTSIPSPLITVTTPSLPFFIPLMAPAPPVFFHFSPFPYWGTSPRPGIFFIARAYFVKFDDVNYKMPVPLFREHSCHSNGRLTVDLYPYPVSLIALFWDHIPLHIKPNTNKGLGHCISLAPFLASVLPGVKILNMLLPLSTLHFVYMVPIP